MPRVHASSVLKFWANLMCLFMEQSSIEPTLSYFNQVTLGFTDKDGDRISKSNLSCILFLWSQPKFLFNKKQLCAFWLTYTSVIPNMCQFCLFPVPEEFTFDPVTKTYGDPQRRPEIKSATIEFIAPSEYMVRILRIYDFIQVDITYVFEYVGTPINITR